jgi:beta-exotoxin I transport system permease protein
MSVTARAPSTAGAVARMPPDTLRSFAAVVRGELRAQRRAPLTWGGSLGAMCALMAAMWPSIEGSMTKVWKSYPSGLKEAFGIRELSTVEQYVDAEMLSLVIPLALAFFVVRRMASAIAGAEERGHLDALLSVPLSRRVLVAATFTATGIVLATIIALTWAMTMAAGALAGTGMSAGTMARGFANVWPLAMAFGGLATLAAGLSHRAAVVTAVATGTLFAMYVLDLVGKLAHVGGLRTISAFRYYGSAVQDGFDVGHAAGLAVAALLLAAAGAALFERRDVL